MNTELTQIEQRSEAWFEIRLGKATASRFKDILSTLKSGTESAGRKNYRAQLVVERLTGAQAERFKSAAMEWGTETEELARTMYLLKTGNLADEVGFIQHNSLEAGASPDGLVGEDGTIEIKCYNTANHIQALRDDAMPKEHMAQVQGQLWMTGRKWCDFISFEPTLPANAQIFIRRIYRDDTYISNLEIEVAKFLEEVDSDVEFIKHYKQGSHHGENN
jgi:putative phage-type endonuclease